MTPKSNIMNNRKEILSLLSEMITFVKSDHQIYPKEHDFIYAIALQLGVQEEELNTLSNEGAYIKYKPPKCEADRILQFHRLILLMNVDQEQQSEEVEKLYEFGVRMGLSPFAIGRVLKIMNNYEDKIVPPKVLMDIFKTYYN